MNLEQQRYKVVTRRDFALFVEALLAEYKDDPKLWGRNTDIESFLEAISSSSVSIDGIYANSDEDLPTRPTWRLFAEILWMAADYE